MRQSIWVELTGGETAERHRKLQAEAERMAIIEGRREAELIAAALHEVWKRHAQERAQADKQEPTR